ncbi:MAG: cyclic 2,3-diphosphoglycerate synthase [Candidatus Marinimicrobia bacterium]|nr:cyclic 2,3-diphosphoglycerate synthase [Candidatus Neomarinimicrobiota bacterium]MDP6568649.1 cyclic 2,3-diphosphoglycerate synthase [Candidatus Neomarinimicrobiota bacterium]MDP7026566.1 cyclic 2,3-diphosphoglycerate synthase [Candidatus Neomarinimicrobiota bacterium]|tara:strand:+ start:3446 stop:4762 length:1317 start_codon:yes stop_codon:yes gene_type:complete
MKKRRVLIMGAAGRDFHNFNTVYRDNPDYEVVAFTATQIPNIEGRTYPAELAGELYPNGIPIHDEADLTKLIMELQVDDVVFSYSDVPHEYVMHKASKVIKYGANFVLLGGEPTMIKSKKPVVAIGAVRTGCGKSQTTRRVAEVVSSAGEKVVVIRHPMPYGDLAKQKVQRFATLEDLKRHDCTIEEMEEYEPHIVRGSVVYAGVDYKAILDQAEKEADIILWDGGNNDLPFYKPDLFIVVADPHRVGHELSYFPGESNLRMADVVVINKMDSARPEDVSKLKENIGSVNPNATVIEANSPVTVENREIIAGKRCLIVEDGPTLTHGEMKFGAGTVAAEKFGASEIIDPRPWIEGTIAETFEKYPDIGHVLPAMGYGGQQMKDLEATINAVDCDVVVIGTPIDLRRIISIDKPSVRVTYDLEEIGSPDVTAVLKPFLQ